jgi:hypothetical protein
MRVAIEQARGEKYNSIVSSFMKQQIAYIRTVRYKLPAVKDIVLNGTKEAADRFARDA